MKPKNIEQQFDKLTTWIATEKIKIIETSTAMLNQLDKEKELTMIVATEKLNKIDDIAKRNLIKINLL